MYAPAVVLQARCFTAFVTALSIVGASVPVLAAPPALQKTPGETRPPPITSVMLLPTAIAGARGARPVRPDDADLGPLAQDLDTLISDTAQDLGLAVIAPPPASPRAPRLADADLLARAMEAREVVILPSLRATSNGDVELRLAMARPKAASVELRDERVPRADLSARTVVLLRDLVSRSPSLPPLPPAAPAQEKKKLAGRITLMANSAVAGGLAGFSIELASGSNDPRLLYPLMIAGAGVGLGAAYLASGEWEVGTGDAWYFASGLWWPTAAGHLIFQGRFAATRAESDRWVFGLVGSGLGASIATLGLALHPMSDAGAVIAHSGGAAGMLLGAFTEMAARRSASQVPYAGMGYGAALGWLAAAATATQVRIGRADRGAGNIGGMPLLGVIGESSAGARSAPVVGLGYAGALPLPF